MSILIFTGIGALLSEPIPGPTAARAALVLLAVLAALTLVLPASCSPR